MSEVIKHELKGDELEKLREIASSYIGKQGAVMSLLHKTQDMFGYIPYEAQVIISETLDVPVSEIYGVITFYAHFSLVPVGQYKVCLCMGTACYVKGAGKILDVVERDLGIKAGETSEDGMYTVEATRCIGACGLAPVMSVNDNVHGRLNNEEVRKILNSYK